ncbi:uroporphyrinogen-III synthase [Pseudarthrobacter sp. J1738]|uniref:uroporphyrinogen-III synthase n=1 Tax=Pseudarthrobacter sp. J1738 TaxID=3420446 RepID=UPI003D26B83A
MPLNGYRVLITRSPDRAGALCSALKHAGAEPWLLPLIDFERASDQHSIELCLDAMVAGGFDWLVVSSITTVRALKEAAAERGTTLAALVPERTKVATIGPSSRAILEAEGLTVHLAPTGVQSAEGLLDVWPAGECSVLLPQADIAAEALCDGLRAAGAEVRTVTAYHTVDYPARPEHRLTQELEPGLGTESATVAGGDTTAWAGELDGPAAVARLNAGGLDAVVAASPSAARRIHTTLGDLGPAAFIAIGESTAAQARTLGIDVAATAATPTPQGIVQACMAALAGANHGSNSRKVTP